MVIGIGVADNGRSQRIGGVIAALETPHDVIAAALGRLGRHDATAVTAFTDGDKMLRGYLLRAGIEERPVLDWPHLARRVQVAKTTAKGLRALTEHASTAPGRRSGVCSTACTGDCGTASGQGARRARAD